MKRLLPVFLVGALSLQAQAVPDASMQESAGNIVLPARPYKMFPQDWDAYAGKYDLSNGQTMVLRRRGLRMYAEIANRPPAQLVAVSENVFVATDRQLKMRLVDDLGYVSGEMLMVAPAPVAAQAGAAFTSVKMSARQ